MSRKTEAKSGVPARTADDEQALALSAYGEDSGAGFEDMGQDDFIIPFLNILQKGSPQVDDEKSQYLPGAKAGMVINSVTEELYPSADGIRFIPVHRDHKFIEWVPRLQGGGFLGTHDPEDPMVIEARKGGAFGKLETPEGNDLVETFYVFGLALDADGGYSPALMAFSSTQIKAYKRWMTQMRSIQLRDPETGRRVTPPMFSHVFRLRTRQQENQKGSWHGWSIGFDQPGDPEQGIGPAEASRLLPTDELYQAAKEIRNLVTSGTARVAYDTATQDSGADSGEPEDGDVF